MLSQILYISEIGITWILYKRLTDRRTKIWSNKIFLHDKKEGNRKICLTQVNLDFLFLETMNHHYFRQNLLPILWNSVIISISTSYTFTSCITHQKIYSFRLKTTFKTRYFFATCIKALDGLIFNPDQKKSSLKSKSKFKRATETLHRSLNPVFLQPSHKDYNCISVTKSPRAGVHFYSYSLQHKVYNCKYIRSSVRMRAYISTLFTLPLWGAAHSVPRRDSAPSIFIKRPRVRKAVNFKYT